MSTYSTYTAGYFGIPVVVETTPSEWPFASKGDTATEQYTRTYRVQADAYTPAAALSQDPKRAGFYLVSEERPERVTPELVQFRRTYASQTTLARTEYSTTNFTRPSLDGYVDAASGTRWVSFDGGESSSRFDGSAVHAVTYQSGTQQYKFDSVGLPVGTKLAIWSGTRITAKSTVVQNLADNPLCPDADKGKFLISRADVPAVGTTAATHITVLGQQTYNQANGSKSCAVRNVTRRYLVGVSAGIASPADIPLADSCSTQSQWFAALSQTWAPIGVSGFSDLGNGWIEATTQELKVADAIEEVTVS